MKQTEPNYKNVIGNDEAPWHRGDNTQDLG
jgi:hypothetical protein